MPSLPVRVRAIYALRALAAPAVHAGAYDDKCNISGSAQVELLPCRALMGGPTQLLVKLRQVNKGMALC